MSGEEVLFELYALSDMNTAVRKLGVGVSGAVDNAVKELNSEHLRLLKVKQRREEEVNRWTKEVDKCQAAYRNCRSHYDDDGYPPPCRAELRALENAQNKFQEAKLALEEIKVHLSAFDDQTNRLRDRVIQMKDSVSTNVSNARAYLTRSIEDAQNYVGTHASTLSAEEYKQFVRSVNGAGTHGARYRAAVREYYQRVSQGEEQNVSSHLRGWATQEVNRGGNYRSPFPIGSHRSQFEMGHSMGFANIDIPEALHFQLRDLNHSRARLGRRLGVHPRYF